MVPLQEGSRLADDALIREGFGESLQTQVVVLQLGELLVLLVELRVVAVIAFPTEAAPLLNGCVIVPPIERVQVFTSREAKLKAHLRIAH